MDTREFLEAVWPATGIYCLATPYKPDDAERSTFAHYTKNSIDEFVKMVDAMRSRENLFFCVHTLKEARIFNPNKRDRKTGQLGAYERRTQANMSEARCFFFDLDIGESTKTTPKYETRQEALNDLERFLFLTGLPTPLVTSSGGGYHVYFRLSDSLGSVEWRSHAATLRRIADHFGLKVDPSRTTDQASVLRIVGSLNIKPGREPLPCEALEDGVETPTATFIQCLDDLRGRLNLDVPAATPSMVPSHLRGTGNLQSGWSGPSTSLLELTEVCEHARDYCDTGYTEGGYVSFYHLGCGLIPFVEDGEAIAMDLALKHPRCTEEYAAEQMAVFTAQTGGMPSSCANLDAKCGGDACSRCPFAGLGKNPLRIADAVRRSKALPPPVLAPTLGLSLVSAAPALLTEPPHPWKRTAAGIVQETVKKVGDKEVIEDVVICPYDMFPFEVCDSTAREQAYSQWAVTIPKTGQRILKVEAGMMVDAKAFHLEMENNLVHVKKKHVEAVMNMWRGWLGVIQKDQAAQKQWDHLGWADADRTQFILPNTLLNIDGTQSPCAVSNQAKEMAKKVCTKGTLAQQIKNLDFYKGPKYFKHQFAILAALAAPALQATGHAGLVINLAGQSGGGKSAALECGGGMWGNPVTYVINGTRTGSTLLRQQTDIFTLSNLPSCIDEINKAGGGADNEQAIRDYVMGSTQFEERTRLSSKGVPIPGRETFKSTFYLCTSNKSFHDLLSAGDESSNASNMRVYEMWFTEFGKDGKTEADQHRAKIKADYGWVGPAALEKYMQHRQYVDDKIRECLATMDRLYGVTGPERFWTSANAVVLVYGRFAKAWGLIPFDMDALQAWLLKEHLPSMRGDISKNTVAGSAQVILASFLHDRQATTLLTHADMHMTSQYPVNDPHSAIDAEYNKATMKILVRMSVFRDWLHRKDHNAMQTFRELERDGVILDVGAKRTLGAGTNFARGRAITFTVDMTHPEFAGVPALVATSNVVQLKAKGASQ